MSLVDNLKALPLSRQIMLGAAVFGVVGAMTFMVQGATKQPMAILYSGIEPAQAGEVIDALEKRGVKYEVRGESIYIASSQREEVRFALAREGLPQQGVQGYELLDGVNGFSVTSEMYTASYWRAKEGELTRTILAIPGVEGARVHIGANLRSGFSRSTTTQTASVTISTSHALTPDKAEAIQYLVALAVSGLSPDDVAVIDAERGIVAGPNADANSAMPDANGADQAGLIEQKILRLLEARVGAGNARVSVSVDLSRERARTSQVVFDPDSRVIRSRTTTDTSESREGGGSGLTVSSNLPQGNGSSSASTSSTRNSTENVSYEVNETRIESEKLPGEVERISVAVLLNQDALGIDLAAAGAQDALDQVVADVEALVKSGAGVDDARGDAVTVELMPFQVAPAEELITPPSAMETFIEQNLWSLAQGGMLGLIILVLGVGVIRPMLTGKPKEAGAGTGGTDGQGEATPATASVDPIEFLKGYTRERQDETAALIQEWLAEDEKKVAVNER